MWVEQSYKQLKHALGWSQYQVRSDLGIRRHWQLVCWAFSFCWWTSSDFLEVEASPAGVAVVATKKDEADTTTITETEERGKKGGRREEEAAAIVAESVEEGEGVVGAMGNAMALLEGILGSAPTKGVRRAA
jgi:hypothetical protein